jgi:hypothetical protein
MHTGNMSPDISTGLQPDGTGSRWLFDEPTPGAANNGTPYPVISNPNPVFSLPGGFMTMPADIEISGAGAGDTIWYTTDGSLPGHGSILYSGPVHLTQSTVISAVILIHPPKRSRYTQLPLPDDITHSAHFSLSTDLTLTGYRNLCIRAQCQSRNAQLGCKFLAGMGTPGAY